MKAVDAARGQATIPKRLREQMGIRPGTLLELSRRNGVLIARKVQTDPVARVWLSRRVHWQRWLRRWPQRCG